MVREAPMLATYAAELGSSGAMVTGVFQMWSGGKTGQAARFGEW